MFPVCCNFHKAKIADLLIENAQIKEMYHMSPDVLQFSCGSVPGSPTDNQAHRHSSLLHCGLIIHIEYISSWAPEIPRSARVGRCDCYRPDDIIQVRPTIG